MPTWLKGFIQDLEQDRKDRSIVIVYTVNLETALDEIIKRFIVDDKNKVNDLLDDERFLGTLSSKIRIAYCLGLISKDEHHDLDIIRKIRNEFAHSSKTMSLNINERISNLRRSLVLPNRLGKVSATPKGRFLAATIILRENLEQRLSQAKEKHCKALKEIKEIQNPELLIPILIRKD